MRIGFDVSQTGECKAGCGYFAHSLIKRLELEDKENQYLLYPTFGDTFWDPTWFSGTFRARSSNFSTGLSHSSLDEARAFWWTPPPDLERQLGDPDIIHANNFFCPPTLKKAKVVYTLYDLAFVEHPEWTTEENRVACFTGVFNASLYADRIISISEYSRRHFVEIFPHFPAEHVRVIYPASRFSGSAERVVCAQLDPKIKPNAFWLHVGTLEPRKNHRQVLLAYAKYRARHADPFPLVLAGGRGWLMDDFDQTLRELELQEKVLTLGYVDDDVLRWLYGNCYALVFPSLFEGFGLPVVEAMSLGAPVIVSNASSLPEIVGNAGVVVDPDLTEEIAGAMLSLVSSPAWRHQLGKQATERAKIFSWERAAKQTIELYRELYPDTRRVEGQTAVQTAPSP